MIELAPEQILALAFGTRALREPYSRLLRLDRSLGRSMPHASPPIVGQIRLAWWREQIQSPSTANAPDPVLLGLEELIRDRPVSRSDIAGLVDAWEILLVDSDLTDDNLHDFSKGRGGGVFRLASAIAGVPADAATERAGMLWALADFSRHCTDCALADRALVLARELSGSARELPRALRPFAILAHFAESDAERGLDQRIAAGSPRRIAQAWKFVLGIS